VFLLDVIEHFCDAKVLGEINRILKKNGMLLLSTPNKYGIYEYKEWVYFGMYLRDTLNSIRGKPRSYFPYHINLYSKNDILETVKAYGFNIEDAKTMGFCLPFLGNVNLLTRIYNSKNFCAILEYFEKRVEFLNFLIILKCRKKQ
jgi:2-polyprenyl-3-methyl-5-hydroxy-6-metoxy-1,4-benzoquinol methylase